MDQPQPGSFIHKREEPGNEVDISSGLLLNVLKRA
jgi:hypothetical protein